MSDFEHRNHFHAVEPMPRLNAEKIDKLNKESYYIAEAISVCSGLLDSVQNAKNLIRQQCDSFLDEMSLSKDEWTENLEEINAVEKYIQTMMSRYLQVQSKVQKKLDELDKGDGGYYVGRNSPVDR